MARRNLIWLLAVPGIIFFGLAMTISAPPPENDYRMVRTIVDVLAEVDQNYVRKLDDQEKQELVENMINGGLEKLDPHSRYFNEVELNNFNHQSEGEFGGVGIRILKDPKTGYLKVQTPMPGTPAFNAGVLANDLILKVDGKVTADLTIAETTDLIMGEPGTSVTLLIKHEQSDKLDEVTLTRAKIEMSPVMGVHRQKGNPQQWDYMLDPANKIGLIRLITFSDNSTKEVVAAIKQLKEQGVKALILDMRDNPGGLLTQAEEITNLFINDGVIVSTRDRNGNIRNRTANSDTLFPDPPMAVLVNEGSASAAEIVAAALQDHNRAVVVGERSYGKGSVQKIYTLDGGRTALKLTSETWLTPKGKNIHRWPDSTEEDEWGVKPNKGLNVELTLPQRREYVEHINAIDTIGGKPDNADYVDPVLQKAVEALKNQLNGVGQMPAELLIGRPS